LLAFSTISKIQCIQLPYGHQRDRSIFSSNSRWLEENIAYLSVCVCSSQPTRISSTMSTNYLPVPVTFKEPITSSWIMSFTRNTHSILCCTVRLPREYIRTTIKPTLTHSENIQATHSTGLQEISCEGISSLQWPVFIINYITPSEQKVNNCRLLLKLLCCQKHLVFTEKTDWGTKFPSFSYCSYPSIHRRNYGIQDSSHKALVP